MSRRKWSDVQHKCTPEMLAIARAEVLRVLRIHSELRQHGLNDDQIDMVLRIADDLANVPPRPAFPLPPGES